MTQFPFICIMKIFSCAVIVCVVFANVFVMCMACGDGYFLDENRKCAPCPEHCLFCDSSTICLSCESGYWGNVCEVPCSKCKTGTSCEKTNGVCLEACRVGFSGVLCDASCDTKCFSCKRTNILNCVKCAFGRYPPVSCDNVCSTCNNTTCDDNGNCTFGCVKGYWGKTCNRLCPKHCLNEICDWNNGTCINGFKSNFTGSEGDQEKKPNTSVSISVVVLISVLSIILTVAVVVLIVWRQWRSGNYRSDDPKAPEATEMIDKKKAEEEKTDEKRGNKTDLRKQNESESRRQDKLYELAQSIKRKTDKDYQIEWEKIPEKCSTLCYECNDEENRLELEELGIGPYEQNKVSVKGKSRSYYFNASYIAPQQLMFPLPSAHFYLQEKGRSKPTYIACIGPTKEYRKCFEIFWRMVWQEKCQKIVMLNTVKRTNEIYWPKGDNNQLYDLIHVNCTEEQPIKDYISRRFEVREELECLPLMQFQYTTWPEKEEPINVENFLEFIKTVHTETSESSGPIIVHGRAGVGRTGTFIALNMLWKAVEEMLNGVDSVEDQRIDIRACVEYLRSQRVRMVETVEQYKFLHEAFAQIIFSMLKERGYQFDNPI